MINLYSVGSKIRVCLLVSLCCFLILSEVIAKPPAELGPKLRQRLGEKLGNFNPSADDVKGIRKLDLRNLGDDQQLATLGGINQFDGLDELDLSESKLDDPDDFKDLPNLKVLKFLTRKYEKSVQSIPTFSFFRFLNLQK